MGSSNKILSKAVDVWFERKIEMTNMLIENKNKK